MIPRLTLLLLLFTACATPTPTILTLGEIERLPAPKNPPILIIAAPDPPSFWTGEDTFKRTHQIVHNLGLQGWTLIAPWEYDYPLIEPTQRLFERTNLLLLLKKLDLSPSSVYILAPSIRESASSESVIRRGDGAASESKSYRRNLTLTLTLLDPRLDKRLFTLTADITQDPLSDKADVVDDLPTFTAQLPSVLQTFTQTAAEFGFGPGDPVMTGGTFRINPQPLELFAVEDQSPLQRRLNTYDPFEQLARKVIHYQFFLPDLEVDDIRRLTGLPPGTEVLEPGLLADFKLRAGDYLVRINNHPIEGAHAVERLFRRLQNAESLRLEIVRDEQPQILIVP